MRFLNKAKFWAEVEKRYPNRRGEWFWNCFVEEFDGAWLAISSHISVKSLVRRTLSIPRILNCPYPLIAFPDFVAGWKNVSSNRRFSPVEIRDEAELASLILEHIHFRERGRAVYAGSVPERQVQKVYEDSRTGFRHIQLSASGAYVVVSVKNVFRGTLGGKR